MKVNSFLKKKRQTVMFDEQVRTNKAKDKQSQERTDLGMNSVRWQKIGVLLRQWNDIAVIDIFNGKESIAIIDAFFLFIFIPCC